MRRADRASVRCAIDASGDRLFTDAQIPALSEKSGAALDRIFTAARRLSGLSDDDIEEIEEQMYANPT